MVLRVGCSTRQNEEESYVLYLSLEEVVDEVIDLSTLKVAGLSCA